MSAAADDAGEEFATRMQRLGELIAELEQRADAPALEPARALLRAALAVHESGLRALLDGLRAAGGADAGEWLEHACKLPAVSCLLQLHDLHPVSLAERVRRALGEANRAAHAGAHAELIAVEGDRVRIEVRTASATGGVDGSGHAGAVRLRRALEQLLCEHAPDAVVELHGGEARPEPLVPASRLIARIGGQPR